MYGWDKKKFKEFNKSRAVTKDLCITRHGEEEGLKMWEEYCQKQSYTNSLEYFINKYGKDAGTKKFNDFCKLRLSYTFGVSAISQNCFKYILDVLKNNCINYDISEIYFAENNGEFIVSRPTKSYSLDFYDKKNNIIVEFNGSLWHADPRKFKSQDVVIKDSLFTDKNVIAQEIWDHDKERLENVKKCLPDVKIFIIWESDWKKDPDKAIEPVLEEYTKIYNK